VIRAEAPDSDMLHRAIHTNVMDEARNLMPRQSLVIVGADGARQMKAAIVSAQLLVLTFLTAGAPALAKFTPVEPEVPVTAISLEDTTINSGPAGAMLESNYFNAPQRPLAGIRVYPCSVQVNLFQKTHLIRTCD
jgi:hypothetical protein